MEYKLLEVYHSLSKREVLKFQQVLKSGSLPASEEQLKLQEYLENLKKKDGNEMYTRQTAHLTLFPGLVYNDQRMRLLESGLLDRLEAFLADTEMKPDPLRRQLLTLRSFARRDCEKAFQYSRSRLRKQLSSVPTRDALHVRYESALEGLAFDSRHLSRKKPLDFNEVVESLDAFFIAAKLKHACEVINARNVLTSEVALRLINEVRELSGMQPFVDLPVVAVYRLIYDSLTRPEQEEVLDELAFFMSEEGLRFPVEEQREIFQYMKNYCVKKLNTGRTEYTRKLFEIYRLNLSNKELLKSEPMSPWEFKNIVTIGLRLEETEWVKGFINDHLQYLEPSQRANAEIYNMGNYHYHLRDYRSTLRLLQQVEFTDLYYALDVRALLLKIYFEQSEDELFFYQASAFRTFLSRNRLVSDYQKTIYRNFINFASRIIRSNDQPEVLKSIISEMENVRQIADLRWLVEQAANRLDS